MGRMVRKQLYIEPRQEEMLKRRAKELGVSEAEVIRRAIEQASLTPADLEKDRLKAWEELKASMLERAKMDVPQTGRTWTREELYEERFKRYSR